jgi:plastocyanin
VGTSVSANATTGPGTVSGTLPPAAGGFPSIVILEPEGGATAPAQQEPPEMDQLQQTFIPAVLLVRTGQPVEFRNSDEVLHNVRVREDATHAPAFNVAIPTGEKYVFTFQRDGFYDVGCDIHPGMSAQIVSSNSPYAAVADAEGNYTIANVPAGAYKATIWAGAQKIEKPLTVAGQTTFNVGP